MLSLTDELRKFEKLACQTQLDGVITIEDGFSNGTVTVRDLVRQNHVIVGQFKRMKNVFINYTKLNQKIYDKITEHELTFGASIIKLGNMNNFFEKTIDGTLDKMKQVYEHTVLQNRLAGDRLSKEIDPIWAEMRNKVDIAHFNQTIRNLSGSSQHDSNELLKQESVASRVDEHLRNERDKERLKELQPGEEPIPLKKAQKNKKISEEELTNIKAQVMGQLSSVTVAIENNMEKVNAKIEQVRKGLLATIEETYHQSSGKINELETRVNDEMQKLTGSVINLTDLLNKRTNTEVWQTHKKMIMDQVWAGVQPLKLKQDILTQQNHAMNHKFTTKLNELRNEMTSEQASLQAGLKQLIVSLQQKTRSDSTALAARIDEANRLHKQLQTSMEKSFQESSKITTTNKQEVLHEILDLRDTIKDLSASLQASVLKQVVRSFQKTITKLEYDMTELHRLEKEAGRRIDIVFEHLNDIKEVTGRKANFTDIVGLFEKKASKQQVTVLKDLLSSTDLMPSKQRIHMHTSGVQKTSSRFGGDSGRLKSTAVARSNFPSPDRSLSTSIAMVSGRQREARFLSKRFRLRPHTAEQPLFN